MEGWVDLGVGYIPRWFICSHTVTYPRSSNHMLASWPEVKPRTLRSHRYHSMQICRSIHILVYSAVVVVHLSTSLWLMVCVGRCAVDILKVRVCQVALGGWWRRWYRRQRSRQPYNVRHCTARRRLYDVTDCRCSHVVIRPHDGRRGGWRIQLFSLVSDDRWPGRNDRRWPRSLGAGWRRGTSPCRQLETTHDDEQPAAGSHSIVLGEVPAGSVITHVITSSWWFGGSVRRHWREEAGCTSWPATWCKRQGWRRHEAIFHAQQALQLRRSDRWHLTGRLFSTRRFLWLYDIQIMALEPYQQFGMAPVHRKPILELQSVTCHTQSHRCHLTQVNVPHHNSSQTDQYSVYLPEKEKAEWTWVLVLSGLPVSVRTW